MPSITVSSDWVLVYNSGTYIVSRLHTGEVTSQETVETFSTEGIMNARIATLGLIERFPQV